MQTKKEILRKKQPGFENNPLFEPRQRFFESCTESSFSHQFSKSWNKLSVTPQKQQPSEGRKHKQREPVCHSTNITLVQGRGQVRGNLSLGANFNSITDCILELLSALPVSTASFLLGRAGGDGTSCCSRDMFLCMLLLCPMVPVNTQPRVLLCGPL